MARALHKERSTKQLLMKTNPIQNPVKKSTYALLVQSEEKESGIFETFIYGLLIVSAVIGIWQFAHLKVASPFASTEGAALIESVSRI
jgi:hypothetical protein